MNARRASSCWRRRSCIVANAEASSPISSDTLLSGTTSVLSSVSSSDRLTSRSWRRRRTRREDSAIPSRIATPRPTRAAYSDAVRTTLSAVAR